MQEAKAFNIQVNPPDISASKFEAVIEDIQQNTIRMGLNCIKGLGAAGTTNIMNAQPYATIQEFFDKTDNQGHNKKNVEVCIKIGAFESLPLKVSSNEIDELCRTTMRVIEKDDHCLVYMNRAQQKVWFDAYMEVSAKKTINNYLVDITTVPGVYLNEFNENDFIYEKKTPNCIVVPETMLARFGKTPDMVEKTRCKPKGIFILPKEEVSDKLMYAFIKAKAKICKTKFDKIKAYLDDIDNFEISFIKHPLMTNRQMTLFEDVPDGQTTNQAGIIKSIESRKTKTGKTYYNITLLSPFEVISVRVWDLNKNTAIKKGALVEISGIKRFGALNAKSVRKL